MLDPLRRIISPIGGVQSPCSSSSATSSPSKKDGCGCRKVNLDGGCSGMYNVITERGGCDES
jgi:hypothetical protein